MPCVSGRSLGIVTVPLPTGDVLVLVPLRPERPEESTVTSLGSSNRLGDTLPTSV
ncbi:MAG: hypothetical protein ACYCXF_06070 [Thermoleophilia bacterium]